MAIINCLYSQGLHVSILLCKPILLCLLITGIKSFDSSEFRTIPPRGTQTTLVEYDGTRSLVECANRCGPNSNCTGFRYFKLTMLCRHLTGVMKEMECGQPLNYKFGGSYSYKRQGICPTEEGFVNFTMYGANHCIGVFPTEAVDRQVAKEKCYGYGGHMIKIDTLQELAVFQHALNLTGAPSSAEYWTDMWWSYDDSYWNWEFICRRPVFQVDKIFDNFEPDEDCVSFKTPENELLDWRCYHLKAVACQVIMYA